MTNLEDSIWLADFMDTSLYRLELLGVEEASTIPFSGNYTNGLVIIHDIVGGIEGKAEQLLLGKIMQAVQISLSEVALININELESISLIQLQEELNPKKIIGFGKASIEGLPAASLYEIGEVSTIETLTADSLAVINKEVAKKKLLWSALQAMFNKS